MLLNNLQKTFSGTIIEPGDDGYMKASTIFARKGSPAIILQCKTPKDVASSIQYAQEAGLLMSVRSGGHSNAGLSTNDGGVVIDVTHMNSIEIVNEHTGLVRLGAGATWENVARTLYDHGLAISSGDTRSVGVAGLSLGGGIGWMVRKYGLAIDTLQSVDVVASDGQLLKVSADSHPDLFWAIRGGGGNFGVATAFEFIAHPTRDVFFGSITYSATNLEAQFMAWRDYMMTAPEELTTAALLVPSMNEQASAMFIVHVCWASEDADAADAAIQPLRRLPGSILKDTVTKKHYYDVLEGVMLPPNVHPEVNNAFFHTLTDQTISQIVAANRHNRTIFQVRSIGGAINRVPADATAFAHRDSKFMVLSPLLLPIGVSEADIQIALKPWYEIAKNSSGAYVNFFSRVDDRTVNAAYPPETLRRLVQIKTKYDPVNIFNQNINIKPINKAKE